VVRDELWNQQDNVAASAAAGADVGSVTAGCVMMVMMMMNCDSLLSVSSGVAAAAEMMMMMMMNCDSLLSARSGVAAAAPAVTHCCRRRTYHRCCKQL